MQTNINGNIIDIRNRKIFPGTVTVQDGRISRITHAPLSDLGSGEFTRNAPFILPGFIDSFTHIDMTQLSPCEYARKALTQGVVGALCGCGDSTSVLGKDGILAMIENSKQAPFYFGFAAPSTIRGKVYTLDDIEALLAKDEVTHLGYIENFPSVILHEYLTQKLFDLAAKYKKPVDGFAPGVSHANLVEYCKSPISTDHACRSCDDATEKISAGLMIQVPTRDKLDFASMLPLFNKYPEKLMLCSDIIFGINIERGYLNMNVAQSVRSGCDVFNVLRAACINPVEHYGLKTGTLQVDDSADFIVVDNLESGKVLKTFIKGECVYDSEKKDGVRKTEKPLPVMNKFGAKPITEADISIPVVNKNNEHSLSVCICPSVTVIDTYDGEVNTVKMNVRMRAKNGFLYSDQKKDVLKTVLLNRYGEGKPVAVFAHGFGMTQGACAMTISHEEQHVVAVGVEDKDIVCAIDKVIEMKGGMVISVNGEIKAAVPLPFAGLMSVKSAEDMIEDASVFFSALRKEIGCTIAHPVRTLSYITDVDIPTIKVTQKGLFSVVEQELLPLIQ